MRFLSKVGALVMLLGTAVASTASAKFAASNGEFSGREGDTCVLCHARAATTPPTRVVLEGLPARWDAGVTYELTIRVEGGPAAMPAPRPRGGFELEVSGGTFAHGPGMESLLRFPQSHVITYTPEGTRLREWRVDWTAPGLERSPTHATFWLAGVAANGNHFTSGDDGASGDASDALVTRVRASEATLAAWRSIPLEAPIIDETTEAGEGWTLRGHHTDDNATHLGYRVPGGSWRSVPTDREWTLMTRHEPTLLALRSEGWGRVSPSTDDPEPRQTPIPYALAPLAGLLALLLRSPRSKEGSQ